MKKIVVSISQLNLLKRTYFICLLICLLAIQKTNAQCPEGDVELSTQQEVNNFVANYPNCTNILGDLRIGRTFASYINSISGLSQITSIEGSLYIYNNTQLYNLNGLQNLTTVGHLSINYNDNLSGISALGNLNTLSGMHIVENPELISLTGLNNISSLTGNIVISNNASITTLTGLENLSSLDGSLIVGNNQNLSTLTGIDNLGNIGGYINIRENDNLTSLSGLNNLSTIGEYLDIEKNPNLISLSALENVNSVLDFINIRFNNSLVNLEGLDNISTINRYLQILNNDSLISLSGLENLSFVGENLSLSGQSLNTLSALQNLNAIGKNLSINATNITTLSGLENLSSIGEDFSMIGNDNLTTLSNLENLGFIGEELRLNNNPNLSSCSIAFICDYLQNGGTANVGGNASGCSNLAQIESNCTTTPPCPFTNLTFNNQQQIDDFITNYPNCTNVIYDVHIGSNSMIDISSLSQITSIGGNLDISYDHTLTDLTGLENLSTIGGDLVIDNNYDLIDFTGLDNLSYIGGNFTINENRDLIGLASLENLDTIAGNLRVYDNNKLISLTGIDNLNFLAGHLEVQFNDALTSLATLSHLNTIGGGLTIENNNNLTTLAGLEQISTIGEDINIRFNDLTNITGLASLQTVGGNFSLVYTDVQDLIGLENLTSIGGSMQLSNNALTNIEALNNLTSIGGSLVIYGDDALTTLTGLSGLNVINDNLHIEYNTALMNLTGLDNITSVGDDLIIKRNFALSKLQGLESLNTIQGSLQLIYNPLLTDLVGLDNLTSIDNYLIIDFNSALTTLTGLNNLTSAARIHIGGRSDFNQGNDALLDLSGLENLTETISLNIKDNDALTSLEGLENLVLIEQELSIGLNSNLSICNIPAVCDFLSENPLDAAIFANPVGCNNLFEVETACTMPPENPCGGTPSTDSLTHIFDQDLFIDGLGFANNPVVTFTDPATPADAVLTDISLELYFRLNGNTCENEIALQLTDPAGNTQPLTAYTTCDGGNGLYYINLNIPSGNTTGSVADWVVEFDDTNDQNSDYEYSVRFARLNYVATTGGGGETIVNEVSKFADSDLFIDGVGFENNGTYTFPDPGTLADAVLSDISLELYFRLNGNTCENEIALQITDPAGNTQPLTAYTTCDGGNGLYYVNLNVPSGNTTGSAANWVVEFNDTNDQNADYEYSVRFGRLTYTTTYTQGGSGMSVTVNEQITDFADSDLFIDGVGFDNNGTYTFTDPGTPTDAVLSNISLELYFRLNGSSCENEIALQITDPAGNTQPLTAYTTCDGGNGLYYVNLNVPSGNTIGSITDWTIEFDDTNDQNSGYEYSVRFGRLTYDAEYTECMEMLINENNSESQQLNNSSTQQPVNSSARQHITIQHDLPDVSVFPNPTTGTFQVKGVSQGTFIIHDTTGRIIQSGNVTDDLSIDISQEARGVYFMSIQIENETITKRIVKM